MDHQISQSDRPIQIHLTKLSGFKKCGE